jgi:hypothetical protein
MTWDDHYRRRAALKSVLEFAEQYPGEGLPYDRLPAVQAAFADRRELLLALQYDWSQALWARVELLSLDARLSDASELAQTAWLQCAAKHPVLRRLLDEHRDELGSATQREQEIMTSPLIA